jgi:hypothetical protein
MIRFLFFLSCTTLGMAQVGIGTITPSDASMLDVNSTLDNGITYKGFMPPRIPLMSDLIKINADINDAGLQVFILETGCIHIWNSISWEPGPCVTIVTGSEVEFTELDQSQREDVPDVDFSFTILNPSAIDAIVLSISADTYADIDESVAQTVTIPAGVTSYTASAVFSITNDSAMEPSESIVFTATVLSGGFGTASMGTQNTNTLTIFDDDSLVTLTIPFQESFETNGNGTRYNTSIPEELNGTHYFSRGMESSYTGVILNGSMDGSYLFAGQNLDDLQGGTASSQQTLIISNIVVTGETNVLFEVLLAEDDQGANEDWDGSDLMHIDYNIDSGAYQPLLWVETQDASNQEPSLDEDFNGIGDNAVFITDTWTDFMKNIPIASGNSLNIRITMNFNSAEEDIAIDNIRITSN